jgi:hypothetical protein
MQHVPGGEGPLEKGGRLLDEAGRRIIQKAESIGKTELEVEVQRPAQTGQKPKAKSTKRKNAMATKKSRSKKSAVTKANSNVTTTTKMNVGDTVIAVGKWVGITVAAVVGAALVGGGMEVGRNYVEQRRNRGQAGSEGEQGGNRGSARGGR